MSQQPTVSDRLRWLLQTFKYQKNIRIHEFNEHGIEPQPHGWEMWSEGIKAFLQENKSRRILSIPVNERTPVNMKHF